MNPPPHVQIISELLDDIAGLENLMIYAERRILAKRAAITEIMHGQDSRDDATRPMGTVQPPPRRKGALASPEGGSPESKVQSPPPAGTLETDVRDPSVREMVESVLSVLNAPFRYPALTDALLAAYPAQAAIIRRGLYSACGWMVKRGRLQRLTDGEFTVPVTNGH